MIKNKFILLAVLPLLLFPLSGCSSIAKGVTEAVLERKEEDRRQCEIAGAEFDGVEQSIEAQEIHPKKVTKVLMVHGISTHLPGYSNRFQKKLYDTLNLNKTDEIVKTIRLDSDEIEWGDEDHVLGELHITRHMNDEQTRELIFYELTWSPITTPQKEALAADSANTEGLPRSNLNGSLKSFMNATVPDMLIYNGNGYEKITKAIEESVCWMLADDWDTLPESGAHSCAAWKGSTFASILQDDHFFVTHSLGSRITIDTIQNFASRKTTPNKNLRQSEIARKVRQKEFTVFMMANQLPLLQMGRNAPDVPEDQSAYCSAGGKYGEQRVMKKMNIVAFSDPNDILSYPIPTNFAQKYIDSRICPSVVNVSLNVAPEQDVFGTFSFANPALAHNGYIEDDRVITLIANGMHRNRPSPLIEKSCKWMKIEGLPAKTAKPSGDS